MELRRVLVPYSVLGNVTLKLCHDSPTIVTIVYGNIFLPINKTSMITC